MSTRLIIALTLAITGGIVVAHADPAPVVSVDLANGDTHTFYEVTDVRVDGAPIVVAQADTTQPAAAPAPAVAPAPSLTDELAELKTKYEQLKAARSGTDGDLTLLAWAAMIAAALKVLLSAFNRWVFSETKSWTKWIALGAAVPIALLSHYALGHTLFESLIVAGAGPGAIIVHELLQRKKPAA